MRSTPPRSAATDSSLCAVTALRRSPRVTSSLKVHTSGWLHSDKFNPNRGRQFSPALRSAHEKEKAKRYCWSDLCELELVSNARIALIALSFHLALIHLRHLRHLHSWISGTQIVRTYGTFSETRQSPYPGSEVVGSPVDDWPCKAVGDELEAGGLQGRARSCPLHEESAPHQHRHKPVLFPVNLKVVQATLDLVVSDASATRQQVALQHQRRQRALT